MSYLQFCQVHLDPQAHPGPYGPIVVSEGQIPPTSLILATFSLSENIIIIHNEKHIFKLK